LKLAINRKQWRAHNVFMVSLIGEKRSIPLYWRLLDKRGCSNIDEQKALLTPVLELLSDYEVIVLGDSLPYPTGTPTGNGNASLHGNLVV